MHYVKSLNYEFLQTRVLAVLQRFHLPDCFYCASRGVTSMTPPELSHMVFEKLNKFQEFVLCIPYFTTTSKHEMAYISALNSNLWLIEPSQTENTCFAGSPRSLDSLA